MFANSGYCAVQEPGSPALKPATILRADGRGQKCRCAPAGKHNDLETSAYTALATIRSLKMLGQLQAFGDYFKAESYRLSWEANHQGNWHRPQPGFIVHHLSLRMMKPQEIWKKVAGLPTTGFIALATG